jgi:hypothetical protein
MNRQNKVPKEAMVIIDCSATNLKRNEYFLNIPHSAFYQS